MGKARREWEVSQRPLTMLKDNPILPITNWVREASLCNEQAADFVCMEGTKFPVIQSPVEI